MKLPAANCRNPVLVIPATDTTMISDNAKATRWRSGSPPVMSLRHTMASAPAWELRNLTGSL